MEPVSCSWTDVCKAHLACHFGLFGLLLSCSASSCGFRRTVAARIGLRLLDRFLRAACGAVCLLPWCGVCVSIVCVFGLLTHWSAQISVRASAIRPAAQLDRDGAGDKVASDPS